MSDCKEYVLQQILPGKKTSDSIVSDIGKYACRPTVAECTADQWDVLSAYLSVCPATCIVATMVHQDVVGAETSASLSDGCSACFTHSSSSSSMRSVSFSSSMSQSCTHEHTKNTHPHQCHSPVHAHTKNTHPIQGAALRTIPAPNSHISIQVVHILTGVSYLLSFTHNLIESLTSKGQFRCYLQCGS